MPEFNVHQYTNPCRDCGSLGGCFDWCPSKRTESKGPKLIPTVWPACWQSLLTVSVAGEDAKRKNGRRVIIAKNGGLTYTCPCGDAFSRHEGELVPEAQAWVKEHTPHLPLEEQTDVSP